MLAKLLAALVAFLTSIFPHPDVTLPSGSPSPINVQINTGVITQNLDTPWALDFLPRGDMVVTQRPGTLTVINQQGEIIKSQQVDGTLEIGEGGLLGVAVAPNYAASEQIYLYYTYKEDGGKTLNRVVQCNFYSYQLGCHKEIVGNIPGSTNHNGGRLKFGPDNKLYITTGDAQNPSQSQDKNSLAGKILVWDGKEIKVYSYGHRNPQGLAWDESGQLWETEHGPTAHDEVNKITQGNNYGWPTIVGNESQPGMNQPILQSGEFTWAPSGMTYWQGSLYFAGLRGQALYQVQLSNNSFTLSEHFKNQYGRLRDVELGPDGYMYLLTSNRDGRGSVSTGDDKIIRIDPTSL